MNKNVISAAKKTILAIKNPYNSIEEVFPDIINKFEYDDDVKYVGIKNTNYIPESILEKLSKDHFYLHTLDKSSLGGRAIDTFIMNPITARPMTGSSSGTAVNVFLGINDLGVGTDGGGSVLAPAMSLNLFGFISNEIEKEFMENSNGRVSTDGIAFSPSIGYICKDLNMLKRAVELTMFNIKKIEDISHIKVYVSNEFHECNEILDENIKNINKVSFPKLYSDRNQLIEFLNVTLPQCDVLLSYEGPVDLVGTGDSVLGHCDDLTQQIQNKGGKGLIRVVNMVNATALVIPTNELSRGIVLICESKKDKIDKLFAISNEIVQKEDPLFNKYFSSFENYFPKGFGRSEI